MIMKEKKMTRILGLAAPLALAMGLGVSGSALADEGELHTNASGGQLMTTYGECVKSAGPRARLEACGDIDECALDTDGDGVGNCDDTCPDTPAGVKVDANGCEIIDSITIDLVNDEFDFDKAVLKPDMKAALDDVAARINASAGDEQLTIVGHTDSVGRDAYNMELGQRRADATAAYLAGQGVDADNITTKSVGEENPIADNGTAAGRAANRRVEILTR